KVAPPLEGLDLNRNFPVEWKPEGEQYGAGPFPLSEPETRAHMEAIVARPNITGYIAYHTFSGVHLRPYASHDDDFFPVPDLRAYQLIAAEGARPRRLFCPGARPARVPADRRRADETHGLPGDLDLARLQVRAEAVDRRLD